MKSAMLSTIMVIGLVFPECTSQKSESLQEQNADTTSSKTTTEMTSLISMFEIPASDISRAVDFYQAILNISIEKMDMPGMQMGIFPYEDQLVTGVIIQAEGYQPSADGVTIYLNGGDNLQLILDKVEKNGGRVLVQKTLHADESGYFAIFQDSEGNKVGLHSPN
jgi:predicted enzyme related to lactoylglutathione lyase